MITSNPVEIEFTPGATKLYIFFGGIGAGIAMPPFEFYRSAQVIDEHKIFVRDFAQCWYHCGLPGLSHDLHSTADYLDQEIKKLNPAQVYFVGNSMGGYAAILFATMLGYGEAIAFAPQTFISPRLRLKHFDLRWQKKILKAYYRIGSREKVWDLKPLLEEATHSHNISIYVAQADRLDNLHSTRLRGIPGVTVHEIPGGGHGVVKLLRDQGELPAIMRAA